MAASASRLAVKTSEIAWREVGDEIIILDLGSATYLSLNGAGRRLWSLLVEGATTDELAAVLVENYAISEAQAASDVAAFVARLHELGVLESTG